MKPFSIVGILNVTPDSYFDGGKFVSEVAALKRVGEMLEEGADIIDIGGESTGPGSKDISVDVELARTIPVITAIKKAFPHVQISVDTYKAEVALQAIKAGATMVNDVTAGRGDKALFNAVAGSDVKLVLMYSKDFSARTTVDALQYDDVVKTITEFLSNRKQAAMDAGVLEEQIILDPGMGHFISSDPQYSFEVLERLREFSDLGCPIYVSPSRKSFLAGPKNLPPSERLSGTIAASALAVLHGAEYIRTHDVHAVHKGCAISMQLKREHQSNEGS